LKLLHSAVWAVVAGAIFALLPAIACDRKAVFGRLHVIILAEIATLAASRWTRPLTRVAERYTDDRRPNFDSFLLLPVARWSEQIFTVIPVAAWGAGGRGVDFSEQSMSLPVGCSTSRLVYQSASLPVDFVQQRQRPLPAPWRGATVARFRAWAGRGGGARLERCGTPDPQKELVHQTPDGVG
jgi:hypothetical protein